jgi:uncharacterized membrane protein
VDVLLGLFAFAVGTLVVLAVPIAALVALSRASQALSELRELRARLDTLSRRLATPAAPAVERAVTTPLSPVAAPAAPPVAPPAAPPAAPPVGAAPRAAPGPHPGPVQASPQATPSRTAAPRADFATNLGPRILVGAGGLAVVVFLGLFVRYAWENDWVGPLGRVVSAALFSLGLLAAGLRLVSGRYRPLGQGLTAAGFSGLYVTAWAAHEVYGLVSRGTAFVLLVAVVACAVSVALRRDARLLSVLAWLGGYLAPVLVASGEDRAESLFGYLLLLGVGAAWLDRRRPWPETLLIGACGTLFLYVAWYDSHFAPDRIGVAAAGLVALAGLFALGSPRRSELAPALAGFAVVAGGCGAIAMAGDADRPLALLGLLVAQALVAALAAPRWAWTPALAAALGAPAVTSWLVRFAAPGREAEALALGFGVAATHVGLLTLPAWRGRPLGLPGALAHVVASTLAFVVLDRVEGARSDERLFLATLALAFVHLALGLAAQARGQDALRVRVALGLAASFLTLAIPVRFGLSGTTLAWAVEGLLLLWLGCRQRAALARAFGYGVLLLAVCRLFLRHLPLHEGAFAPVLNPAFLTWLGVVAALALARRLARRTSGADEVAWLDGAAVLVLGPLALSLLLGLLTAETRSYFAHAERNAAGAGDRAGALRAERQGGLAVSVLWTLFATALLSVGLAARSLPLFYTAYGLFAVTAAKVVLVDLATLPTLYRMLSFLALGVLLLAGAWLNLRFRERLSSRV